MSVLRKAVASAFARTGIAGRSGAPRPVDPVEFSARDRDILNYVIDKRLTMGSRERVIATIAACKHAVDAETPGDFVECGVWRGGNSIAAKLTFEAYGSDKQVWLFDTFAGMTAPSDVDTTQFSSGSTEDRFRDAQADDHNEWCFASLDEVRGNCCDAKLDMSAVHFVQGDVTKTLQDKANLPAQISVLRLDTDFYDSTKAELDVLYPRLSIGGSILLDDYGHWEGAKQAVEEYFAALPPPRRPLLQLTDYTGRMGVKVR